MAARDTQGHRPRASSACAARYRGRQASWLLAVHHGCRRRLAAEYIQTTASFPHPPSPFPVSASGRGRDGGPPHTPTHPPPQPWFPQQTPPPGRPGSYPSSVSAFPAFQFWPCLERTSRLTKAACRPSPARSSVVVPSRPITSPNSIRNLTHRLDPPTIPEPNARSFSALRVIHRVEPVVSAAALQQQHHAPRTQSSRPALGLSALHTPRPPCHPL